MKEHCKEKVCFGGSPGHPGPSDEFEFDRYMFTTEKQFVSGTHETERRAFGPFPVLAGSDEYYEFICVSDPRGKPRP